ncbi:MAG: hypothetical protein E7812_12605 [Phenylobacterium sp.]|nr:MAG: hypothetical protein E7812_12605 [Phenylobacterium sp.]
MSANHPVKTLLLLATSGLALAGCKIDNRPLLARNDPPASALPDPGPIGADPGYRLIPVGQAVPARAYPYAEQAYSLDRAFYDTPPDYGFDYSGEQPWVWQTADDSYMFAEPYGEDYRYYYYQPGQDYPYFVRTSDYGYAYGPDGALIALFTAAGALISANDYARDYPQARSYWSRGYDMRRDFGRAPRTQVDQTAWSQRAPLIARSQQRWLNAPATQPAWRQWRNTGGGQAVAQRVAAERPARVAPATQAPQLAAQGRGFQGRNAQGQRFAAAPMAQAPQAQAQAQPRADRGRFAATTPAAQPAGEARVAAAQPIAPRAMARNEAPRFARQAEAPRAVVAPSVQDHGRPASFRAPPPQLAAQAAPQTRGGGREQRGGGQAPMAQARAQAAPRAIAPPPAARMAQAAAPPAFRGGGQPHAQPQPQPHPAGAQPHAAVKGDDKKHGG